MGRKIVLNYKEQGLEVELVSVDRRKLYGWREVEIVDENDLACDRAALDEVHQLILPKGGVASGYLSADGLWLSKDDLTPVDLAGDYLEPVPSSFINGLSLGQQASADDVLLTDIRLLYQLVPTSEAVQELLTDALEGGAIFTCTFSYRGGTWPDRAFIMQVDDGTAFLLAGQPAEAEYLTFEQVAPAVATEDDDLLDFDLF